MAASRHHHVFADLAADLRASSLVRPWWPRAAGVADRRVGPPEVVAEVLFHRDDLRVVRSVAEGGTEVPMWRRCSDERLPKAVGLRALCAGATCQIAWQVRLNRH
jgi:hypothetical protein